MTENSSLPAWAQFTEDSFDRLGLIAERLADGRTKCNIHVIGGLAGCAVPPEWDRMCAESEALAISIVHRMFEHPDPINAPMARYRTPRFDEMSQLTTMLDDGTRVSAPTLRLAKHLLVACLFEEEPRDTLTLSLETITSVLAEGIHRDFS